ncbi:GNAT family N-acetyltransferase [Stella sp.]|uniref:GNAT family N-acetyltransferase n=1 Tax=Stella sp. TaxID=2912054 RepID=UPI0035AE9B0A
MATTIRLERPGDAPAIAAVVRTAFAGARHRSGTEAAIVAALRAAGALTLSLVASEDGDLVGHVAFSPVTVDGRAVGWFGLGPVAVRPDRQGGGIGQALIREGLDRLRRLGAAGCVVLGAPGFYARFGFVTDAGLRYGGAPPEYFQRLAFTGGPPPAGEVAYHPGFAAE